VPPVAPFVGASDIGHRFNWPETGTWTWELNPGPINIVLHCLGFKPWTIKILQSCNSQCTKYCDHVDCKNYVKYKLPHETRSRHPHVMHLSDDGPWSDKQMTARPSKLFGFEKRTQNLEFIPRVCTTYTTILMSLVKTYQKCEGPKQLS